MNAPTAEITSGGGLPGRKDVVGRDAESAGRCVRACTPPNEEAVGLSIRRQNGAAVICTLLLVFPGNVYSLGSLYSIASPF